MSTATLATIDPSTLRQALDQNPSLAVIDVRTPAEYEEVHVAEARLHPLERLNAAGLDLSKAAPVYVLCRTGGRAAQAARKLEEAGFTQAIVVKGGTQAWIDAGLPVVRGERKVISLERQVRIAAGSLVLTGVVLGFTVHPGFFGLSGFVGGGLIFAGITDWCGMGLLIARAPWNR
jgi:rhodanese-related sulfurtransferase